MSNSITKFGLIALASLLSFACEQIEDVQGKAVDACASLSVRDQVAVAVVDNPSPRLAVSSGVVVQGDGDSLMLSGEGRVELSCPSLQKIQVLGGAQLDVGDGSKLQSLRDVRVYGDGQVAIHGLMNDSLSARASGNGALSIEGIDVDEIVANLGGNAAVVLAGRSGALDLLLGGKVAFAGQDLQAQEVLLHGTGTGPVTLWVTAHLSISEGFVGAVTWRGTPDLKDDRVGSP
ncbi:MAG: hypothetical protein GKR90_04280 [Pseudomonadales bacterium]|nr:hypothetical protein [Pseudomonadales bacterium]